MKHLVKLVGIIALLAVIGLSFASCDNGTGGGLGGANVSLANTSWVGTNAYGTDYLVEFYSNEDGMITADGRHIDFTYTLSGNRIVLYDRDGDVAASGTVSGNTLSARDVEGNAITLTKV